MSAGRCAQCGAELSEHDRHVRFELPDDTFGTWLEVTVEAFDRAMRVWNTPAYGDLQFDGRIANALPPWRDDVLGQTCTAHALLDDSIPFVTNAVDDLLSRILSSNWDAREVINGLPGGRP